MLLWRVCPHAAGGGDGEPKKVTPGAKDGDIDGTGGGQFSTTKGPVNNDLKTKVRQLESGNDYSAMYKRNRGTFARGKEDITKMTIQQVHDLQTDYLNHQASRVWSKTTKRCNGCLSNDGGKSC